MKKEMKKEMRLIDANALLENLGEEPMVWSDGEAEIQERNDWQRFKACVEAQDTVDAVEVVHGRWINTPPYYAPNGNYNKAQECSVCHSLFVSSGTTPYSNHPYCCECGAKMDGGNEQ